MTEGFKRGTHIHHRSASAGADNPPVAATVVHPGDVCGRCGHSAAEHDLDRTVLVGTATPGGLGCLTGWTGDSPGCGCGQFVPRVTTSGTIGLSR